MMEYVDDDLDLMADENGSGTLSVSTNIYQNTNSIPVATVSRKRLMQVLSM